MIKQLIYSSLKIYVRTKYVLSFHVFRPSPQSNATNVLFNAFKRKISRQWVINGADEPTENKQKEARLHVRIT